MLIITCPHCHDSVRIPTAADESSLVRCPRCHVEYRLDEAFASLPPLVEVLSGPGSSDPGVVSAHNMEDDIGYALVAEGDPPLNLRDSGPLQSPPIVGEGRPGGAVRPTRPGGGPKLDSNRTRRPKKPEASPVAEFAKIIIGGAIGLFLAFAGILWFGKKDVLEVVPKLPTQAYFLVPAELRTPEMKELAAQSQDDTDGDPTDPEETSTDENELSKDNEPEAAVTQDDLTDTEENSLEAAFREAQQRNQPPAEPAEEPEPAMEEEPPLELPEFSLDENDLQSTLPAVEGEIDADLEKMLQEATDEIGPIGDLLEEPETAAPPEPDLVEPPVTLEPLEEDSPEPEPEESEDD
ncbi:MAG: hypothetical protein WDZ51_13665 [Pirellulaceae bacterium]